MAAQRIARAALLCSTAFLFPVAGTAQQTDVQLDVIVLQGKRAVAVDTATPQTTIDDDELEDRQAGTIAELVDSVPGVTLMNGSTPSGSGINIRGFGATGTYGSDQMVLIQVDGATQGSEELYRLGTQLYTDPALYKQVTVTRGTVGSFEYGSGVVGGMLQLKTKDASDFTGGTPGFAGRQTLEYSSNGDGLTSSSILAWQPSQDVEFLAQYVWRRQHEQQDGDGEDTGAPGFKSTSLLLKGKYTFGASRNQSVTLSFNDTMLPERDVPYNQWATGTDTFGNVDRDIRTRTTVLAYEYDPASPLIKVEANLSYADQKIDSSYVAGSSPFEGTPSWPMFGPSVMGLANADHRYETTKLTVKNTAAFATGAFNHDLRLGFELIRKKRAEETSAPGGTDRRLALFAVDDITTGGWTFSPSLRYETQKLRRDGDVTTTNPTEYENDAVMGGLSVRYAWANGVSVFASGAYTENLPILDDFDTPAYMGKPQRARVWEVGAAYEGAGLLSQDDALAIKANLYQTEVWDVTSYSGVDQVTMKGIELEAAYSLSNGFYVDLNANVVRGDEVLLTGVENYWTNAPTDRLRVTLGKRVSDALDLSWEAVAADRMERVNAPTEEAPGYVIHNLRATWRPQSGALDGTEVRVGLENIFDTDYKPWLATREAPGRNIKLTIAKTF